MICLNFETKTIKFMIKTCAKAHQNATEGLNDTISSLRNMTCCLTNTHPRYVQLARITSISLAAIGVGATCCIPGSFGASTSTFLMPTAALTLLTEPTICCMCVKELLLKSSDQIQAPRQSTVFLVPNYGTIYGTNFLNSVIGPPNTN